MNQFVRERNVIAAVGDRAYDDVVAVVRVQLDQFGISLRAHGYA